MANELEDVMLEAQEHFERGAELYLAEEFRDAAGELLLATKVAPRPFIEAERLLAHAYRCSIETPEQLIQTIRQYEKVLSLAPNDVGSWCWLALMAEAGSTEREELAKSAQDAYQRSGSYSTIAGIQFLAKKSSVTRQAGKFREIAARTLAQAGQRFAAMDPEQDPGGDILYALEGAVTLADFYQDNLAQPLKAVEWYRAASRVNVDALRDLPDEHLTQAKELRAKAERRYTLLAEELRQSAERRKKKNRTTLIVAAVVVPLLLVACYICLVALGVFSH